MSRSIAEKPTLWKFSDGFELRATPLSNQTAALVPAEVSELSDSDQVRHFIAAFFGTIPARFQIHTGAEKWQLLRISKTM
jgi:hypothetical protein